MSLANELGRDPKTGARTGAAASGVSALKGKPKPKPSSTDKVAERLKEAATETVTAPLALPSRLLEGLGAEQVRALLGGIGKPQDRRDVTRWVMGGVAAIVVAAGIYLNGSIFNMPFAGSADSRALEALIGLLIVALFVERAQHVYIGVLRGFDRARLDWAVERAREALEAVVLIEPHDPGLHQTVIQALHKCEDDLTLYRLTTRKAAFIVGLATGVAISLVGPRVLVAIVDPAALKAVVDCAALAASPNATFADPCTSMDVARSAATQLWWFQAIDVLTTGGLIGGGAEGIHKIVSAITGTADKIRKQEG